MESDHLDPVVAHGWSLDFGTFTFKENHYNPEYFMTLEMDVMFTRSNVIDEILSLFDDETAAVGVHQTV